MREILIQVMVVYCVVVIRASVTRVFSPRGAAVAPPFRRVATRGDKCFDTITLMCFAIIDITRKRFFLLCGIEQFYEVIDYTCRSRKYRRFLGKRNFLQDR